METIKTVLWGLAGIRRKADHERASLKPVQVIVVAIVFVTLFVLALRTIVYFVTS